jgi:signal transduction histidine kinase
VEDRGPGVEAEERVKVFEAFYRVGSELRRETSGTGLGLALVKQVAKWHGGTAVCREAESGGARFELLLPLQPANPDERNS